MQHWCKWVRKCRLCKHRCVDLMLCSTLEYLRITYSALLRVRLAKIFAKLWLFVCDCWWAGCLYHSCISDTGCPPNKLASFHCVHTRTQQPFSVISHHDSTFEPRENAWKSPPTGRDSKEPQLLYGRYCSSRLVPRRTNLDVGERTKS